MVDNSRYFRFSQDPNITHKIQINDNIYNFKPVYEEYSFIQGAVQDDDGKYLYMLRIYNDIYAKQCYLEVNPDLIDIPINKVIVYSEKENIIKMPVKF
jgi:hypothetical protein